MRAVRLHSGTWSWLYQIAYWVASAALLAWLSAWHITASPASTEAAGCDKMKEPPYRQGAGSQTLTHWCAIRFQEGGRRPVNKHHKMVVATPGDASAATPAVRPQGGVGTLRGKNFSYPPARSCRPTAVTGFCPGPNDWFCQNQIRTARCTVGPKTVASSQLEGRPMRLFQPSQYGSWRRPGGYG